MPSGTPQPAFVLVRPQMGENIGGAARAMWNFGLDRMRIVAPRDGWPNQRAVAMASGAGRLLDEALLSDTVESTEEAAEHAGTVGTLFIVLSCRANTSNKTRQPK